MVKHTKNYGYDKNEAGVLCKVGKNGALLPIPTKDRRVKDILREQYSGDLETTTEEQAKIDGETHMWLGGVMDIIYEDLLCVSQTMEEYMSNLAIMADYHYPYPATIWFHNLKFDLSFIEPWIKKNGWQELNDMKMGANFKNTYTVTRDNMNNTFGCRLKFGKNKSVLLLDSAKQFPAKLSELGNLVGVKKLYGDFDYDKYRGPDYVLTDEDLNYFKNDLKIVCRLIKQNIEKEGTLKWTRSSYAFRQLMISYEEDYAKLHGTQPDKRDFENFHRDFPAIDEFLYNKTSFFKNMIQNAPIDVLPDIIKQKEMYEENTKDFESLVEAYFGGLVFSKPTCREMLIKWKIISLDYTSMYPSQMLDHWLPYGEPKPFRGGYEMDKEYPLFIQSFTCEFKLKKGGFPVLGKKLSKENKTIYEHTQLKKEVMTLCNVDLNLFFKNYEVSNYKPITGYKFKAKFAPFKSFVLKYAAEKAKYSPKGAEPNELLRMIAKLIANGSYGKLAESPYKKTKNTYIDDNGVLRYEDAPVDISDSGYLPGAIFITAYAREDLDKLVHTIGMELLMYTDTDSGKFIINLDSDNPEENWLLRPEVQELLWNKEKVEKVGHDYNTWKIEGENEKHGNIPHSVGFKMLREKAYAFAEELEIETGEKFVHVDIKCAGLNDEAKELITNYVNCKGEYLYVNEKTGERVWTTPYKKTKDLMIVHKPMEYVMDKFAFGEEYEGGLTAKTIKGGTVLIKAKKTLSRDFNRIYESADGSSQDVFEFYE